MFCITLRPEQFVDIDSLQWSHNGHDGVSSHQPHHCLVTSLFRRRSKKTSKLCFCEGNSLVTGESPHKGPTTRKMSPFDDVIMFSNDLVPNRHRVEISISDPMMTESYDATWRHKTPVNWFANKYRDSHLYQCRVKYFSHYFQLKICFEGICEQSSFEIRAISDMAVAYQIT